mgnify:CR=1 FL=1
MAISNSTYLISGVGLNTTGSAINIGGMRFFTAGIHAYSVGSNIPTGNIQIQGRADESEDWINLYVNYVTNTTGLFVQFDGPLHSIRGAVSQLGTGTFTIACRYVGY